MNTHFLISVFILIPITGFFLALITNKKRENILSGIAFYTILTHLVSISIFIIYWLINETKPFNLKEVTIYQTQHYEFFIDLYFDKITSVYLFIGSFMTFLIVRYSTYYMHLEDGYKRFFVTILFFFIGYNITVLSGNFETLMIGWEFLGISSFLLIAFYRDRYLPVRNSVKVFSVYRIGDVGLLLAAWASHHFWHTNITFNKLSNNSLVDHLLQSHYQMGLFISICILIAAVAKSAQFPFSYWLPRAMEGPTPSSAIFYGSLSVHFGVFILLRTFPFWEHELVIRILIGSIGFFTAIMAYSATSVQSTIKSQIAYASISQIGIMFIEVACGFETLALIHFTGNAFLRTYQLLISPSLISYKIRDQFYNFVPENKKKLTLFKKKLISTLYVYSLREWGMEKLMNKIIFAPIKNIGYRLNFLTIKNIFYFFIPIYFTGVLLSLYENENSWDWDENLPLIYGVFGLILVFKAFSERKSPLFVVTLVLMNQFFIALAVFFNEHFEITDAIMFLSGILPSAFIAYLVLMYLKRKESSNFDMQQYYGHSYEYPVNSILFLLSALGLMGFPITHAFIGEDLLFSHIHGDQYILATIYSLSYVFGGISLIRVYARIYLGTHVKINHETPLKSN